MYLSWATRHFTPHPAGLCRTLLSYAAPYWATQHPVELRRILLSYAAPSELGRTSWAAPPYWAAQQTTGLCLTLLSYVVPYWAMPHPSELRRTLQSYAVPCWATPHPAWAKPHPYLSYSMLHTWATPHPFKPYLFLILQPFMLGKNAFSVVFFKQHALKTAILKIKSMCSLPSVLKPCS